jgi:hypothetical protein
MIACLSAKATNREALTQGRTMKSIVVIDDKDHALKQAIYEFPNIEKNQLSFRHFDTISAFRSAKLANIFILFLDFFLSKDKDYGTTVIPEIECEHLICFSSMKQMSDHMYEIAAKIGPPRIQHVYSVQKIKSQIDNYQLKQVLKEILCA